MPASKNRSKLCTYSARWGGRARPATRTFSLADNRMWCRALARSEARIALCDANSLLNTTTESVSSSPSLPDWPALHFRAIDEGNVSYCMTGLRYLGVRGRSGSKSSRKKLRNVRTHVVRKQAQLALRPLNTASYRKPCVGTVLA